MLHDVTFLLHAVGIHAMKKTGKAQPQPRPQTAGKKTGKSKMPAVAEIEEVQIDYREESNHPSHLRRGVVTLTEVRELADFLIGQAQTLNGIAKNMERLAISTCDRVDGITKGNRGKKLIAEFTANLNRALTDQQFGS
jgi:hypothetical protein